MKTKNILREGVNGKKTFSFGHCPNHLKPPPPRPEFGQLGPLFSEVEIQDLKVSLELRILYVLYYILYICNLKIPSKLEVAPHALKMCEWVMDGWIPLRLLRLLEHLRC